MRKEFLKKFLEAHGIGTVTIYNGSWSCGTGIDCEDCIVSVSDDLHCDRRISSSEVSELQNENPELSDRMLANVAFSA